MLTESPQTKMVAAASVDTVTANAVPNEGRHGDSGICDSKWSMAENIK